MRQVEQPDHNRPRKRPAELGNQIRKHLGKRPCLHCEAQRNRRIEKSVRAAQEICGKDATEDSKCPTCCDGHPSCAFRLCALQNAPGNDSVPQQDHDEGAKKFADKWISHGVLP
jgi:hypothetical protein